MNSPVATMPVDYYEKNISIHPYKGVQGYQFNYSGNELTVRIEDSLSRHSPIDVFRDYEKHRQDIQDLKKHGYNDEAINMLLKELDEQLLKATSLGLRQQLGEMGYMGMKPAQVDDIVSQLMKEYINLRGSSDDYAKTAQMAVDNLVRRGVMPKTVDLYWGKTGEWGKIVDTINRLGAELEAPYKDFQRAFTEKYGHLTQTTTFAKGLYDFEEAHILSQQQNVNWNDMPIPDAEKEARSLSIVFRVRGDQMIDYAKRYEELSGTIDTKLSSGEITQSEHERYRDDLNTAFIWTYNLNIMGQAQAAGLSDEKATALAIAFSEEYIKIREQTAPEQRNADNMANEALRKIASDGWPEFSLYTNENRASAPDDDAWYNVMPENALYYRNTNYH